MGRPEDPVQRCYRKDRALSTNRVAHAVCLGCDNIVSPVVCRMRKHADACKELRRRGYWTSKDVLGKKQSLLKGFHKANKSTVASALAHLIYATNLPFKWVESRSVQRLLDCLCPGL
jgi:hypothetical protein